MPTSHTPSVVLTDVHFQWPDGSPALSGISGSFGPGRTGLVGTNGSGKSTLLRLIAGTFAPTAGTISRGGDVGYLPQTLTLRRDATLMELLGIQDKVSALRAIESGDAAVEHFDVLGDDWDIEARADEALRNIGLSGAGLDRSVGELSGGEAMLAAISGLRIRRTPSRCWMNPPTTWTGMPVRHWAGCWVTGREACWWSAMTLHCWSLWTKRQSCMSEG